MTHNMDNAAQGHMDDDVAVTDEEYAIAEFNALAADAHYFENLDNSIAYLRTFDDVVVYYLAVVHEPLHGLHATDA